MQKISEIEKTRNDIKKLLQKVQQANSKIWNEDGLLQLIVPKYFQNKILSPELLQAPNFKKDKLSK